MWVHATLIKRGQAVAHCSLEEVQTSRVLEVPLWMLDVAGCCKTRVSKPGFASARSLRELQEVLQAAGLRAQAGLKPPLRRKHSLDTCYMQEVLMAVSVIPRRSSQLPWLARSQCNLHWTHRSSEVQPKIVRLLAQLLRQHRATAAEAGIAEEAPGE